MSPLVPAHRVGIKEVALAVLSPSRHIILPTLGLGVEQGCERVRDLCALILMSFSALLPGPIPAHSQTLPECPAPTFTEHLPLTRAITERGVVSTQILTP